MPTATAEDLQPLLPLLTQTLGHRPSPATVWRWCRQGVLDGTGERRVKLWSRRVGRKLYSTPEAVAEFIAAQNPPEDDDFDADDSPRDAATERRLAKAGLL